MTAYFIFLATLVGVTIPVIASVIEELLRPAGAPAKRDTSGEATRTPSAVPRISFSSP